MSPYLAGIGIGVVLLLAYVVMGRGLGASGAFSSVVTAAVSAAAPAHAAASPYHARYAGSAGLLRDWLVLEVVGITLGALVSALLAGRFKWGAVERGPRAARGVRIAYAVSGGAIMAIGAKLARGCTSGQALTGGALLSVGSWTFVVAAFASAFVVAPLVRRQWR
jgi:uncharacterized membrane protein YedE/YeeE